MKMRIILASCLLMLLAGCEVITNPATGEKEYHLSPKDANSIEDSGEITVGVLGALGILWPVLLPIAGYAGGALRMFRKLKPKLTTAKTEAETYHSATDSIVAAIESFKTDYPKEWTILESKLNKAIGPKAENVIRALRGLPSKA